MNMFRNLPFQSNSDVISLLVKLQTVPDRQPEQVESGRRLFLEQAEVYRVEIARLDKRRQGYKRVNSFTRLKDFQYIRLFSTIMIILLISMVGASLTLAASQSSLPGQAFYPLKLWSEDLRLNLSYYSPASYLLALDFSDQRMREIEAITKSGGVPPDAVLVRLENQSDLAIAAALRLEQRQAIMAMQAIHNRIQSQNQVLEQLEQEFQVQPQVEQTLSRTREMLQLRLRQVEMYLEEPSLFLQPLPQVSAQVSPGSLLLQQSEVVPKGTPVPGNLPGTAGFPAGCISCTPGGTLSPSTLAPGSIQSTPAGSQPAQTTAGNQPNQPGSPSTGENQPGSPPEAPGNQPDKPERPGPGGYRKR